MELQDLKPTPDSIDVFASGAIGGVLESTIAAMERLGASRTRMIVAIGPMLSQANYEVGPEFKAQFLAEAARDGGLWIGGLSRDHNPACAG